MSAHPLPEVPFDSAQGRLRPKAGEAESAIQPLTRLSDEEIRLIFERQLTRADLGYTRQQQFIRHLARALADAEDADFAILRPMLVLLIARHRLAAPLEAA